MRLLVDGVRKRLGGRRVLDDVSLECDTGDVVVIAGPNGAGKTTLMRIIAGVLEPDRGVVEVDGASIVGRRVEARRALGYVPEAADPPGHLSVDEVIALVAALKRCEPLAPAMREKLGIDAIAHQRIERLSLGERRRACLGAALVGAPSLLVLDEPTNGLDADGVEELVGVLSGEAERGAAVVLATHDTEFAERVATVRLRIVAGVLNTE